MEITPRKYLDINFNSLDLISSTPIAISKKLSGNFVSSISYSEQSLKKPDNDAKTKHDYLSPVGKQNQSCAPKYSSNLKFEFSNPVHYDSCVLDNNQSSRGENYSYLGNVETNNEIYVTLKRLVSDTNASIEFSTSNALQECGDKKCLLCEMEKCVSMDEKNGTDLETSSLNLYSSDDLKESHHTPVHSISNEISDTKNASHIGDYLSSESISLEPSIYKTCTKRLNNYKFTCDTGRRTVKHRLVPDDESSICFELQNCSLETNDLCSLGNGSAIIHSPLVENKEMPVDDHACKISKPMTCINSPSQNITENNKIDINTTKLPNNEAIKTEIESAERESTASLTRSSTFERSESSISLTNDSFSNKNNEKKAKIDKINNEIGALKTESVELNGEVSNSVHSKTFHEELAEVLANPEKTSCIKSGIFHSNVITWNRASFVKDFSKNIEICDLEASNNEMDCDGSCKNILEISRIHENASLGNRVSPKNETNAFISTGDVKGFLNESTNYFKNDIEKTGNRENIVQRYAESFERATIIKSEIGNVERENITYLEKDPITTTKNEIDIEKWENMSLSERIEILKTERKNMTESFVNTGSIADKQESLQVILKNENNSSLKLGLKPHCKSKHNLIEDEETTIEKYPISDVEYLENEEITEILKTEPMDLDENLVESLSPIYLDTKINERNFCIENKTDFISRTSVSGSSLPGKIDENIISSTPMDMGRNFADHVFAVRSDEKLNQEISDTEKDSNFGDKLEEFWEVSSSDEKVENMYYSRNMQSPKSTIFFDRSTDINSNNNNEEINLINESRNNISGPVAEISILLDLFDLSNDVSKRILLALLGDFYKTGATQTLILEHLKSGLYLGTVAKLKDTVSRFFKTALKGNIIERKNKRYFLKLVEEKEREILLKEHAVQNATTPIKSSGKESSKQTASQAKSFVADDKDDAKQTKKSVKRPNEKSHELKVSPKSTHKMVLRSSEKRKRAKN